MKNQNDSQSNSVSSSFLSAATGKIDYTLMNDYMFHSVMQSNQNVLKGLLCALLRLDPAEVHSIEILNPIELGKAVGDKDFYLDIKILMNDHAVINLELQVRDEHNWPERSLIYLCRLFDNLNSGDDYISIKPACHISILNFTPFPEQSEFYASYKLMSEKNHHKYSDKFTLHVLDLTHIQSATDADRAYGIDRWAALFKATTWEEFKMIAVNDKNMQEAGETVFKLSQKDQTRYLCEAREEYRRSWNTVKKQFENYETALSEKDITIAEKDSTIAELNAAIARLRAER